MLFPGRPQLLPAVLVDALLLPILEECVASLRRRKWWWRPLQSQHVLAAVKYQDMKAMVKYQDMVKDFKPTYHDMKKRRHQTRRSLHQKCQLHTC